MRFDPFCSSVSTVIFGRTAAALYLSQPALTKQIQRLEARLGGALLIRRAGGIQLTAAGELFERQAQSLIRDAEEIERSTRLAMEGKAGLLRVGFGVAVLARGLPEVILRFRRRYPAVTLFVKNMSTADQLQALRDRSLDHNFVRLPVSEDDIETMPISDRTPHGGLGPKPCQLSGRLSSAS